MILPLCIFIAAAITSGSTNQDPQPTATPPSSPTYQKEKRSVVANYVRSKVDEEEEDLIKELFDPNSPAQRPITPQNAMPAMPHTVKEMQFASSSIFFIGGPRDQLSKHGIDFSATYTSIVAGNPVGGIHPKGSTYIDNIAVTSLIDTEKLFGWHGGHFIMSVEQQDGGAQNNLSTKNVGNFFLVNGAVGGTTIKWVNLYYQQLFYHDRININIGRFAAMDEFDNSPVLFNYIGTLQANPTNIKTTWNPNTSWASRLKILTTHDTEFRFGIFQITKTSINGLNWNFYPNDTASLFTQYDWNPEFGKAGSTWLFEGSKKKDSVTSHQETSSDKSFKERVDISKLKKFSGHYFVGGYYNAEGTSQYTSNTSLANSYAFYWHGDQVVYRPNPMTEAGLLLWTEFGYTPQTENTVITFQAKGGAIYTGLIPGRKNDFTIFGIGYGGFSSSYISYVEAQSNQDPEYELVSELGYRINFSRFFYVQPDMQWIINPNGLGSIPNALVLGVQTGIIF
ncbi:MAG: carbohydrate porin [Chthoniobacterales bacterium]